MTHPGIALLFVLIGVASRAGAAEIVNARVERTGDHYEVGFAVTLHGDAARLKRIITDYARLAALSPTVVRSRVLSGRTGDNARIEVTFRPCVLIVLCKTITKVSDTRVYGAGHRLEYLGVAALSDFQESREAVTLVDEPVSGVPRVRFTYSAVFEPKFFVPPVVGPWIIRRQILNDLETTSERVERIMQREAESSDP